MRIVGNEPLDGKVRAVASGTLSNGIAVIVNSDGTVSAVAGTSAGQAVGTATVFETGATNFTNATFDSANNKVVIVYEDDGSSDYGKAVVGTVNASNNSISFGTPVTFHSSSTLFTRAVFDSNAGKVVVLYKRDATGYARAVIGTVSGTSISFGSPVDIVSNTCYDLDACFDSTNNKIFVCGRDNAGSGTGAEFFGVVGTVSGTSISFGSFYTFESGSTSSTSTVYDTNAQKIVISYVDGEDSFKGKSVVATVSGTAISYGSLTTFNNASTGFVGSVYDPDSQKVIVTYADNGNSSHGTAIVGTVSGTSISFGSEIVFNAASTQYTSATYDENSNTLVVAYRDVGNSNYGSLILGTVSGSSITFSDETVFNTAESNFVTAVYDAASNNSVISYIDNGNSNYGTSIVYSVGDTNLTSDNFIGFADGAYADTQSAAINTTCSVDRSQTGLTAGQKYYVQADGSLGTTAADPSVEAGTAISSTEILVKG